MRQLPEGTVTFLFTDIEGSTALLRDQGDAYPALLAEHRRLLREAAERHGGVVFGSEGDALFIAFEDAGAAVAAAQEGRQALEVLPLRVRMGLHTGRPGIADGDYVGLDVHRVARIAGSAHGGQIVVSRPACEAAGAPEGFIDLGEHRLKDLPEPEWLFQAGGGDFPPLRSLGNASLPAPPTPLVGRARELAEVAALLAGPDARLVTLTGPGGMGKTRLALAVAAEVADGYPNGVFFAGLVAVTDPALVLPAIGQALGVVEQPDEPPGRTLARRLEDRTVLVVLDNVEQVLDAAVDLAELLQSAAGLSLLATSREPLRIRGEREYALPPLAEDEALGLFVERAQAVRADFALNGEEPLAREICERLDRLPLAIELAAARVKLLALPALAERLGERLTFVGSTRRDLPERHRTLRGAIEWSYDLLDEDERALFARLAVFMGGWTLAAAERVCAAGLDTLASLLDKSLLARGEGDRLAMLETIREYALERLAACEDEPALRGTHAQCFLEVAVDADEALHGPEQVEALERLERDHDNLRAALAWALEADHRLAVELAGFLGTFWYRHTHVIEGLSWLRRAEAVDDRSDPVLRARLVHQLGILSDLSRDDDAALRWLEEAAGLLRGTDETARLSRVLNSLGVVTRNGGDLARARALLEECLAMRRALGDEALISVTVCGLGVVAFDEGDLDAAERYFRESLEIDRRLGDANGVATNVGNLAWLELAHGRTDEAAGQIGEALRGFSETGDREGLAEALEQTAVFLARQGRPEQSARIAGSAAGLREAIGVPWASATDRERVESELAVARGVLGAAYDGCYEAGRSLGEEDAVEEALAALAGT